MHHLICDLNSILYLKKINFLTFNLPTIFTSTMQRDNKLNNFLVRFLWEYKTNVLKITKKK